MAIDLKEFGGGLNLRDSPNELALNETPAALNWTLDQRGALKVRRGSLSVVALPGTSGKAAWIFWSEALSQWLCVRESGGSQHLYTSPSGFGGGWTDRGTFAGTFNVGQGAPISLVDFPGTTPKVVITGPCIGVNGVYTWDGTNFVNIAATIVAGTAMALWQNRVWIAGYPGSDVNGNPTRLFYSAIGDPTTWAAPAGGFVDLRDKDASPLTALGIAGGALVVYKLRSAYRVNDSDTGIYSLIDPQVGCIGSRALVASRGRLYGWAGDGLYEWSGLGAGVNVGDKALPLFQNQLQVGGLSSICAGQLADRLLFGYPTVPGTLNNDGQLELDPQHGWLMKHQLASSAKDEISSFALKDSDLYAAVRDGDVIFKLGSTTPGLDDVSNFSSSYKTPWLQPFGGKLGRIQRAELEGLLLTGGTNTLKFRVYKDWDESAFTEFDVSAALRGSAATIDQVMTIIRSLGHARAFQFEFVAGTALGDASVRGLSLDAISLER